MSSDKNRRERRRMMLLDSSSRGQGLLFHAEGGMAMRDHDIRRLIRERLIVLRRVDRTGQCMPIKGSREFMRHVWRQNLYGNVVLTRGQITDRGRTVLAAFGPVEKEYDACSDEMLYVEPVYPHGQKGSRFR